MTKKKISLNRPFDMTTFFLELKKLQESHDLVQACELFDVFGQNLDEADQEKTKKIIQTMIGRQFVETNYMEKMNRLTTSLEEVSEMAFIMKIMPTTIYVSLRCCKIMSDIMLYQALLIHATPISLARQIKKELPTQPLNGEELKAEIKRLMNLKLKNLGMTIFQED
jgi:hypothetical protein